MANMGIFAVLHRRHNERLQRIQSTIRRYLSQWGKTRISAAWRSWSTFVRDDIYWSGCAKIVLQDWKRWQASERPLAKNITSIFGHWSHMQQSRYGKSGKSFAMIIVSKCAAWPSTAEHVIRLYQHVPSCCKDVAQKRESCMANLARIYKECGKGGA